MNETHDRSTDDIPQINGENCVWNSVSKTYMLHGLDCTLTRDEMFSQALLWKKKQEKLVKDLLSYFECPVSLEITHVKDAFLGPDMHLYSKEVARRLISNGVWRSPITRQEFDCPDIDKCLIHPPKMVKNMFHRLYEENTEHVMRTFDFVVEDNILKAYKGTREHVVIFENLSVTKIEDKAFYEKGLTSVTFPDSLISIGKYGFYNNQLTSVSFPESLIEIENNAFERNQLTSIIFQDSITNIGPGAFRSNKLTSIRFPKYLKHIVDYSFAMNDLTTVTFPDSLGSISSYIHDHENLICL